MIERFFSTEDLARRYGVSRETIRNFTRAGKLPPPLRIGGVQRWSEDSIKAFEDKKGAIQ